jgi:Doubled CXXCH motif (Paired_CXXCH_1)
MAAANWSGAKAQASKQSASVLFSLLLFAAAGCAGGAQEGAVASSSSGATAADGGVLAPPDSHPAHRAYKDRAGAEAVIAACSTCHHVLHGETVAFDPAVALPGGTSLAGGTAVLTQGGVNCTVACHFPFGAPTSTVAWGQTLACRGCHATVRTSAARASSHDPFFSDQDPASGAVQPPATAPDPTWCWSCHDASASRHASGAVQLLPSASLDQACLSCHSGSGQTLRSAAGPGYLESTPPVISGWSDPNGNDWHGARAGTGYSGTLLAPYAPGQPALPCLACHSIHQSDNPFLFAQQVNGVRLAPGSISRAGVGAQALCNACHSTDRHASCSNPAGGCHTDNRDPAMADIFYAGNPVDPMPDGSPCFYCHGHEGIRNWTRPDPMAHSGAQNGPTCMHCHSPTAPGANPGIPPALKGTGSSIVYPFYGTPDPPVPLSSAGTAFDISQTSASIYWETAAPATSLVEYGVGTAGLVASSVDKQCTPALGLPCRVTFHRVTLSGLSPSTTYVFRIRSADDFRNQLEAPLSSFTTLDPQQPPAPRILLVPDVSKAAPASAATVTLAWNQISNPSGNPVSYRAQLAADPAFGSLLLDSGWLDATSTPASVALPPWPQAAAYSWRVMARDAVTLQASPWSLTDSFSAWTY